MFLCSHSHLKKLKDAFMEKCEAKKLCWVSRGGIENALCVCCFKKKEEEKKSHPKCQCQVR